MTPENNNKEWTKHDIDMLKKLAGSDIATKNIAKILERTENAVREEAYRQNISLK